MRRATSRAGSAGRIFNTAFVVAPDGTLAGEARKMHVPVTAGTPKTDGSLAATRATPCSISRTCASACRPVRPMVPGGPRALALNGADVIVYPSAIGSEPDHPAFDTEPIWEQVIRAQGVMSGTFMVVINRIGTKARTRSTDRRSSATRTVVCSYKRRAPSRVCWSRISILDTRRDWLDLFPMFATRARPETY